MADVTVKDINVQAVETPTYLWGINAVGRACKVVPWVYPVTSVVGLTGVINQADLRTALGLGNAAYLGVGTTTGTVAAGDHTHTAGSLGAEPTITAGTSAQYWRGDKVWSTLDKAAVGLGNVDNTSDSNKPISSATQTALNGKEATVASGTSAQYWRGDKVWTTLDKAAVGLNNVDNTSDANKPVSTAQQTALNLKFDKSGGTVTGETTVSERMTATKAAANGTWTYRATTQGAGNSERSCYSFYGTFGNTADYGRRRIADILAGFDAGNWGSEYLAFGIGNNGASNDSAVLAKEWARFNGLGCFGLNTNAPTARLDINDSILRLRVAKTPASATDTGNQGNFCWDDSYFYVCVASNTWKRAALATW